MRGVGIFCVIIVFLFTSSFALLAEQKPENQQYSDEEIWDAYRVALENEESNWEPEYLLQNFIRDCQRLEVGGYFCDQAYQEYFGGYLSGMYSLGLLDFVDIFLVNTVPDYHREQAWGFFEAEVLRNSEEGCYELRNLAYIEKEDNFWVNYLKGRAMELMFYCIERVEEASVFIDDFIYLSEGPSKDFDDVAQKFLQHEAGWDDSKKLVRIVLWGTDELKEAAWNRGRWSASDEEYLRRISEEGAEPYSSKAKDVLRGLNLKEIKESTKGLAGLTREEIYQKLIRKHRPDR